MSRDDGGREHVDLTITRLAAAQHGVVTRQQLLGAGIPADVVARRVNPGRLETLHRGVYMVGPVRSPLMAEMAAVLACGESAVLSHRSAATLWNLVPRRNGTGAVSGGTPRIEVTVTADRRRRPGIRVCRVRTLRPDETTTLEGIPITTIPRTLIDLAFMAEPRELERALAVALDRDGAARELRAMLRRHAHRRGANRLRALLESKTPPAFTRSEAEERFLALIRKAQLPMPAANCKVAGYEVDFYWRAERFVVEIDGFAFHSSANAFERDRHRDAKLAAAGVRVTRVTWHQLENEPEAMLVRVAQALARSA